MKQETDEIASDLLDEAKKRDIVVFAFIYKKGIYDILFHVNADWMPVEVAFQNLMPKEPTHEKIEHMQRMLQCLDDFKKELHSRCQILKEMFSKGECMMCGNETYGHGKFLTPDGFNEGSLCEGCAKNIGFVDDNTKN